ncbi:MAG: hypothetical protein WDO74_32270 [Pseudomonadota bacterium]
MKSKRARRSKPVFSSAVGAAAWVSTIGFATGGLVSPEARGAQPASSRTAHPKAARGFDPDIRGSIFSSTSEVYPLAINPGQIDVAQKSGLASNTEGHENIAEFYWYRAGFGFDCVREFSANAGDPSPARSSTRAAPGASVAGGCQRLFAGEHFVV